MLVLIIMWCFLITKIVVPEPPEIDGSGQFSNNVNLEFPFLVGLTSAEDNLTVCTGTLVSSVFVLSSAHCMTRFKTGIKIYRWTSANALEYRLTVNGFVHPSYDSATRMGDLSLIKMEKSFHYSDRFVRLSSKTFKEDVELDCVVVGIGEPYGYGYKVPVRVQYGRSACQIPEMNSGLKMIIAFTWVEFLCSKTIDSSTVYLPCDRGDPLFCNGNRQYGMFSYGYDTKISSRAAEVTECGDPTVQSRHLFVSRHTRWITDTVSKHSKDTEEDDVNWFPTSTEIEEITSQVSNSSVSTDSLILVGEQSFEQENHPYLVYLEGYLDEPVCGGTLISPFHVLTTAYCTTRMTNIEVYLLTKLKRHTKASLIYVHPDYDVDTLTADISIVVLSEPFNIIRYAHMAEVFSPAENDGTRVFACVVVAKRRMTPYHYMPVKVKYGPKACRKAFEYRCTLEYCCKNYTREIRMDTFKIVENMSVMIMEIQNTVNRTWREFICGIPKFRLNHDTGDPLICDGLQYGITSHSYQMARTTKKGTTDQVRFLVVHNYRTWINDVVAAAHPLESRSGNKSQLCAHVLAVLFLLLQIMFRSCNVS